MDETTGAYGAITVERPGEFRGFAYVIKQLELALRRRLMDACRESGLTSAQYTALSVLVRRPGLTSSELARRSLVRAQTMAMTIDPMLETGFVRREPDPAHARRRLLFLTELGARKLEEVDPHIAALEEHMVADLDAAERDMLAELLRRCRRTFE
ncbi:MULTISPECIES: MarR family winged helix-turn-helix transcriptional regulator [unclassified Microbacterium]|uniref:MarR family winged helix-turn-helix transcriptional regulator n=1 Tax=unclassified Microbacterium TaxID=2609290 RepID=UPI00097F0663|nr:MarR family transcriptional regulator [Microbacterium sp. JB110]RCS61359.1 MarR family transcriptional regulator [Microbacterium sp. JB110]SJM50454.1 Transcriptional regulator, MarR family [Frigoribacterium sp. JB110]